MSAEFICDGCGKRAPAVWSGRDFLKPWPWFQRSDKEGAQVACSRRCIDKVAAEGKQVWCL